MGMLPLSLAHIARTMGGEVSGSCVLAPGPNHSRDDRSLSITLSADAADGFVVHSFAGDDPMLCRDHVRARLGLPSWQPASPTTSNRVVAEYVYKNAEGEPYLRVRRTADKQFWQSQWNGSEWVKGKPPGPKIPYRLPDMLAATHSTILIVEGEKDVDALYARRLAATTASEGAGKWTKDLNRWFTGKTVCIIPDNDAPGRAHAQLVAHNILPVARSVRIVELPDLPAKGDVSDWFAACHDASALVELCRAAEPITTAEPDQSSPGQLKSRAFVWTDPTTIPPRDWLYGSYYQRGFVSTTVAPGGIGKSSLDIVEALAMASGKPLLGIEPKARCRVWYVNLEDPQDELDRRFMAAALHYGLGPADIDGWLRVNGSESAMVIAEQTASGVQIATPLVEMIKADIRENATDVLMVDPFVSSHAVNENDNRAIDTVAKTWSKLAQEVRIAVDLVHHARKTNGAEVTVEDGRGASALLAATRAGRVLNAMTDDEAARAGVDRPWQHFRINVGKINMAPRPAAGSLWFKMESVALGNGDDVGVVTAWQWPNPLDTASVADLRAAQKAVADGRWRESSQAKDWVGIAIAGALALDPDDKAVREKVKALLKVWTANRMFKVVEGKDEQRRPRDYVEVDQWAND